LDVRHSTDTITQVRHYELLTPLFGGGVNPGEVDEKFPVRGSTVRGQLRFWWRATCGGRFGGDRNAMKADEDRIWGSTRGASRVSVVVTEAKAGQLFTASDERGNTTDRRGDPLTVGHQNSRDSYAAFPLRGDAKKNKPPGEVRTKVTFTLRLAFDPAVAEDVRAALWAWETFGGVGARTRRGFGALQCNKVDFLDGASDGAWSWEYGGYEVAGLLAADVARYVSDQPFPDNVPHLSRDPARYRMARHGAGGDPMVVWRALVASLRNFRQSRDPGSPKPGRSHWPEPDAIRRITRKPNPLRPPKYTFNKFPRAAFGLPIIFEFKNDHERQIYEPNRTTLEGTLHSRLASPLLLRPLALAGGTFVGLGIVLEGSGPERLPGGLTLKDAPGNPRVYAQLDPTEAAALQSGHPTYNGNPDILQAFLDQL
jgi:CRISPR-associated protein Cmr1